ncbi:KaiA family protein [Nostoc sp. HK-01]|uniref:Circadian clock oscillator protein KaiA n=2 Tax=Nostocales TaxID=1161 RepID=A0A1Z4GJX2_9CYAN|nr:KaiA family protein [Nostoc cycadae]BAY17794.1 KaiA family protein [Anabaenopsis circularis NIES-21]BBD57613.1 KaiA family protein [Nostoc sp. HK-01]GBE91350.1 circadian clock protein KaiA [Nostoc cycadae WK-1]
MLLPILFFQPNVKKILDNLDELGIQIPLNPNNGYLLQSNFAQFSTSTLVAATTARLYYLLNWLPANLNQNFIDQYFYVFACQQQKPQQVFQQMTQVDQRVLLQQIKSDYRQILIDYFTTDKTLKEKIDKFINTVFCANIPVPQIIEIHMELIDEFSKQLKLEGRTNETLLDYRLTLIDVLAHLCEAYRCAISK